MSKTIINCIRIVFQTNKEVFYAAINWKIENEFLFIEHTLVTSETQNIYINTNNILSFNTFKWELDSYGDYIYFEATEFFKDKLKF